ncbi:MAG TPA: hypothetical protein VG077_20760, partial [Verrucomicrobiae bacterium]|nr:hypothetical protein [Verrucomicrobiae bacterium]
DSLFLKSDGSVWMMGNNTGLAGAGSRPIQIISGGVIRIANGWDHELFLKSDGSLWGMGTDGAGQLGDGFNSSSPVPEQITPPPPPVLAAPVFTVTNILSAVRGAAAGSFYSFFIRSDGSLWAMGWNVSGQFGDGTFNNAPTPEQIVSNGVIAVATGRFYNPLATPYGHSLFLKSDGSLWGMGLNSSGQLGDGTFNSTNRPEQIVSNDVVAIAAGSAHSLFLKSDGSLWAMGDNSSGELGDGTYSTNYLYGTNRPEEIVSSNVVAIAAGSAHSLFLKSDGSLWAMGANYEGQLGDGTFNYTNKPEQIVSSGVVAIAAGDSHSLFLKSGGSLWAMGLNNYGQLGDGTFNKTDIPEQIVSSGVVAIAAGDSHSLFLKSDGSLWAMGLNNSGQLGDGTLNNTNKPERIVSSGVVATAAGCAHSLFLKTDGSLWGMGNNDVNQLGNGFSSSSLPVQLTDNIGDRIQATCQFGGTYYLLASTNISQPSSQWMPVWTNFVIVRGTNNFTAPLTNTTGSGAGQQFYLLRSQ